MKSRYQPGGAIGALGGKSTVGILLYSYCARERSSCPIEQRLCDDVALPVVAANQSLAHATSARFRRRHLDAIAGGFSQVVALSVSEGLVQSGVVAIDGTKIEADVSAESSVTRRQIVYEILQEAEAHAEFSAVSQSRVRCLGCQGEPNRRPHRRRTTQAP
jgi:hypothetical protein